MPAKPNFLRTGTDAMETLREEQEKEAQRRELAGNRGPMRFYVRKAQRGDRYEVHELVFLDDDLTQAPCTYEHAVPGPRMDWSKTQHVTCIDDWSNCPVCRAAEENMGDEFKAPKYHMFATVGDLSEYTIQNGPRAGTKVDYTRKLFAIPSAMMDKYKKIFELCKRQHGTTRGMVMLVTKNQKNDARCGEPQMIEETGMLFDMMDEAELEAYAEAEVVRDGKVILEEGENIEPYDYEDILAPKDEEELRRMFNLDPAAGSAAEERGGRRRRRSSGDAEEAPARGRRRRSAQAEEEEAPARGRRRRAAADEEQEEAPARGRRRRSAPEEEPEDNAAEDEQEAPPSRTRRRRGAEPEDAAPPAGRAGRRRRRGGDEGSEVDIPFED